MVKVRKDLTGQKFGRLTVIRQCNDLITKGGEHFAKWECICDCGNKKELISYMLTSGRSKSCGCYQRELQSLKMKKYNQYDLSGEYGIGYTNKGEEFYFDLEDYEKIKDYCWFINNTGYVYAKTLDGSGKHILFHRLLFPESEQVDHKNHNTKDNRKINLRPVNNQKNMMNKSKYKNNKSGVTGVSWHKRDNIWEVHIRYKDDCIYLGRYEKLEDAIKARKEAEEKYFGNYSYNNSMKGAKEYEIR